MSTLLLPVTTAMATAMAIIITVFYGSAAQDSGIPSHSNDMNQEYVDVHNQARAEVGVSPIKWTQFLAKAASLQARYQRDRKNCSFANLENSEYGGNQFWTSGWFDLKPGTAVETWVAEKKFYDYANNSCAAEHLCGVYTQVVWRNSIELGCAIAKCTKQNSALAICLYNPPGNIVGEKPY